MGAPADPREVNGSDLISALRLSQQGPTILGHDPKVNPISPSSSTDTAEEYGQIEQLLLSCLRTGDDLSAQACLDRLSRRFGSSNERVMALRGLYQEAIAKDNFALEKCLEEYDQILESTVNMVRCRLFASNNFLGADCSLAHHETSSGPAALAESPFRCNFRPR